MKKAELDKLAREIIELAKDYYGLYDQIYLNKAHREALTRKELFENKFLYKTERG